MAWDTVGCKDPCSLRHARTMVRQLQASKEKDQAESATTVVPTRLHRRYAWTQKTKNIDNGTLATTILHRIIIRNLKHLPASNQINFLIYLGIDTELSEHSWCAQIQRLKSWKRLFELRTFQMFSGERKDWICYSTCVNMLALQKCLNSKTKKTSTMAWESIAFKHYQIRYCIGSLYILWGIYQYRFKLTFIICTNETP